MPQASIRVSRFLPWLMFLVGLIVYLLIFISQVGRNPLRADEVDFFRCMQNVVDLGRPLYYAGEVDPPMARLQPLGSETLHGRTFQFYRFKPETGILKETFFALTDGNSRYTYCLWHPPLYVYLGALFLGVFDIPVAQANLFRYAHLVFVALMFYGLALLVRELYGPRWPLGLALATLFLALSNLSVTASILIDYNGALAMCVVIWLVWAFVRADREPRYVPLVVILMALTFGVGLGVGAASLLGLLLWTLICHRAGFLRHALVLAAGLVLFLVAFGLLSRLAHFPFSQPFLHNFQRAALQTPAAARFTAAAKYLQWYAEQIGVIAIVIALFLAFRRVAQACARQQSHPQDTRRLVAPTLVLVALVSQASLSADAWGFPKYIAFALPLLFAFVGGELADLLRDRRLNWLGATLVALLLISLALPTARSLRRPGGALYMAGEQGVVEAGQAVAANSLPGETFLGSKDVSFYAERKFVQWSGSLWTDLGQLQRLVRSESMTLAAASQGQLTMNSEEIATWLAEHGVVIASPGEQRVYQLR